MENSSPNWLKRSFKVKLSMLSWDWLVLIGEKSDKSSKSSYKLVLFLILTKNFKLKLLSPTLIRSSSTFLLKLVTILISTPLTLMPTMLVLCSEERIMLFNLTGFTFLLAITEEPLLLSFLVLKFVVLEVKPRPLLLKSLALLNAEDLIMSWKLLPSLVVLLIKWVNLLK